MTDSPEVEIDLSSEEGRHRFLADLAEGAEVGRAVAQSRTSVVTVGAVLEHWVDLLEATLDVCLMRASEVFAKAGRVWEHAESDFPVEHQTVDMRAWRGQPQSTAETELAAWLRVGWPNVVLQPSHQQDRGPAMHVGRLLTEAAVDHLRGLAIMLADGRVSRPPLALARVILDAAAHVHYLFDPGIDADERLVRALNELLARAGEDYNAAARADGGDAMAQHEQEVQQILDAVGDRLPHHWDKQRRRLPVIGEQPISTARMTNLLLEVGTSWYDLSGVVHNKEDGGWRIMLGHDTTIDNPHAGSYVSLHTFAAVIGMIRVIEAIEAYTSWDLGPVRAHDEDLMQVWPDASGMRDEQHRARIMAERQK